MKDGVCFIVWDMRWNIWHRISYAMDECDGTYGIASAMRWNIWHRMSYAMEHMASHQLCDGTYVPSHQLCNGTYVIASNMKWIICHTVWDEHIIEGMHITPAIMWWNVCHIMKYAMERKHEQISKHVNRKKKNHWEGRHSHHVIRR